ncbi:MAG: hypothetical protein A2286_12110 [Gammaproteobacteria bacterium RIFOXYA12_FULL_61_12]|nr:MAG: hypothetical protein A2286_12110 [Gammaproteobacteria bacterium RIFOXYA12_FULL_61_12]OGT90960.1 MAG: hypothetical protein A2514_07565 [Gammaproteobacteria bacterium RIFOXYD12_FULL_61_37]
MKTRDEYIEDLAAELKEWSAEIDLLTAKIESVAAHTKLKYIEEIEALCIKQQAAAGKIQELKAASGDAWESVRATSDKVWDELRVGLAVAVAKFK